MFEPYNYNVNPDSINSYYAIYHDDYYNKGVRGKNRTYFFYSEYGDAYLNGDLHVTGAFKNDLYSGSLTDGAPTDAQIEAAIGATAEELGAGFQGNIVDTDGAGNLFHVITDGTDWWFEILTATAL
jgi:hypothetical protein